MSLQKLWAPWRQPYITRANRKGSVGCFLCQIARSRRDTQNLVLTRGHQAFSLLNLFPYNNGHLLVAPYRHTGEIGALDERERLELFDLMDDGITRLKKVLKPHGFNVGLNLGRAAGAGIPDHLHWHIVPRWIGDTNFMPICADTKVVSQSLRAALAQLKKVKVTPRISG